MMSTFSDKANATVNKVVGAAKEKIGQVTNDRELEAEGAAQHLKGDAQEVKGNAKGAVKNTIDKI